jgi:hypothetical protein
MIPTPLTLVFTLASDLHREMLQMPKEPGFPSGSWKRFKDIYILPGDLFGRKQGKWRLKMARISRFEKTFPS